LAGPSLREGSPRGRASAGTISAVTSGAVTGIPAIVVLLALGLILRFIIAYVLLPGSGFPNDLGAFQAWGNDIAQHGPIGFYDRQSFIDYPPVYLLLLGAVSLLTGGNIGEGVKLVPMLADLGLAVVVWVMAQELGVNRKRAFIAALIVLINPITWFNSAIWGQADAVGSIFLLLGLRELQKDRRETASVLAVLAALTKMQLGILGFVVGFVILRRSLAPKTGERQPERILTSLGAGLAAAALACLPFTGLDFGGAAARLTTAPGLLTVAVGLVTGVGVFALGRRYLPLSGSARQVQVSVLLGLGTAVAFSGMVFDSIVTHLVSTFGEYPYLTLNAYNPWALLADGGNAMDRTHAWLRDAPWTDATAGTSGTGYIVGPFSVQITIGVLVVLALLVAAAFAARRWSQRLGIGTGETEPAVAAAADAATGPAATGLAATGPAATGPASAGARVRVVQSVLVELGGLWGACLVTAGVVVVVLLAAVSGHLYAVALGDGLLLASLVGVSLWAAWRDDAESLLVAVAILAIAFFVLPTRAHERYLFPFFGLGAILLAVSWRWSLAYVILAVVNAANLLAVLVQYQGIPAADGTLAGTLNDWGNGLLNAKWEGGIIWPIAVCGVATGLGMVWALLQLRPRAVAALGREVSRASMEPEASTWWSTLPLFYPEAMPGDEPAEGLPVEAAHSEVPAAAVPATAAPDAVQAGGLAPAAAAGSSFAAGVYSSDVVDEEEWFADDEYDEGPDRPLYVPQWVMRLWHRLARPSTHPDRSASIDHEPRGRLDKLDLWVVLALAVVILSMRAYRLDEPQQMHFDEVYHARTATEFLQDWRYDIPHGIYEYTHPHLAKYAIAAGITLFSDDKVTATGALDSTVKGVLVQPRTPTSPLADPSNPDSSNSDVRYGDRLFVATGSDVRVYDLATRALVQTYAIPGASAFSDIGVSGLVYVGTTTGRIYVIDTNNLDDVRSGRAQAAGAPKELAADAGLSIARLYAGTAPYLLVADSSGNIVSIDLSQDSGTIVAHGLIPGVADFADLGVGPSVLVENVSSSSPSATPSATPSEPPAASSSTLPAAPEVDALASALGLDKAVVQSALNDVVLGGISKALNLGPLSSSQIAAVQQLITAGQLPNIQIQTGTPQVMVAYASGIGFVNARTLTITSTIGTDAPATSIAINYSGLQGTGISNGQSSYVTAGNSLILIHIDQTSTPWTVTKDPVQTLATMPGFVTQVVFDRATRVAQVLGRTPDGSGWTVYAIETNGNAVFSDATLPFQPVAIGLDSTPMMPDIDHEQVLAVAPDGSLATVDVGQFAFSWRIIGVLFGVLMAVCLYLLARLLFKRRSIGLLVALFSMTDGMLFVQSRIAMNDTYVGGFLLLAYLLFAILWLDVWKSRYAFWLGMPIIGVVLGLALFSKWVALYAIASMGILILVRSSLGRLITILGLAAGTGVLGWMAIGEMTTQPDTGNPAAAVILILLAPVVVIGGFVWALSARTTPDKVFIGVVTALIAAGLVGAGLTMSPGTVQNGAPNYTFFMIMLVVTALAAAANAYHPIAWTREELWFAIGAPVVVGVLALLDGVVRGNGTALLVGAAGVAAGPMVAAAFWFAGRLGFGPLAPPPGPNDPSRFADPPAPAPKGWLRLGSGYGIPAAWMSACLVVLPILVYVILYIPWSMPWQPQTAAATASYGGSLPVISCPDADQNGNCINGDGWPSGHTGKALIQLTIDMYNYHNDLRQPHAASSPWWAWPMDLKPVWFENATYTGDMGTMIYDGGNPAIWWLAITAMAFVAWQAFKRRSLGLTLVLVAFLWQWLSWSRIDRAAFQYHFYTALPFFLLALAYFLAELWHGPSRRTWLLARVAAAGALIFPAVAWLLKYPLCGLARVSPADYWGNTICGNGTGEVRIETRMLMIGVVLVAALIALALILWRLERRQNAGHEDRLWIVQLLVPVGIAGALLWWFGVYGPRDTIFQAALPSDGIALVLLPVLAIMAFVALTARNPRRFVLAVCCFVIATFLVLYPNLSALPLPNTIINVYEAILPTWFYGFQFSVNLQEAASVKLFGTWSIVLTMVALFVAGFFAWAAWEHRVVLGYRRWKGSAGPGRDGPSGPADDSDSAGTGESSGPSGE
jgi:predicted membrane-bound dolichyl-phosphate-mannose-protein mannosyltransferase